MNKTITITFISLLLIALGLYLIPAFLNESKNQNGQEIAADRTIRVYFDTNVATNLPIYFKPNQPYMDIKVGQEYTVVFSVKNQSTENLNAIASYNVVPAETAPYFVKIECFCFLEQTIEPNQQKEFKVVFFIDPEINKDRSLNYIKELTLSYTFHKKF